MKGSGHQGTATGVHMAVIYSDVCRHHGFARLEPTKKTSVCNFIGSYSSSDLMLPSVPVTSLLPVLTRGLRHLWLLRQEVHEHADLLLRGAAHLLHHPQLPHRR